MNLDRLTDEELIARARREAGGADACLAELYRRYYSKVAAWCLRIGGDRQEAADLAQEVFLRVHERLGSFRGDSRFSTWLYTVTRSVVITAASPPGAGRRMRWTKRERRSRWSPRRARRSWWRRGRSRRRSARP